jgi:hypothetical protein
MSYPYRILRRKPQEEGTFMNEENAVIDNTIASEHPVLIQYKTQIATLQSSLDDMRQRWERTFSAKNTFEEKVKNVLIEAIEDHDEDTVRYIANQLNVDLTVTKTYEINVTFRVDVELEIGEDIDPDWDFDFTVSSDKVVDYSSDIIWSNEVS